MPKLNFPKKDPRANGKPFVKDRPWIKQGAYLSLAYPKRLMRYYCPVVHFDDAPRRVTDMIPTAYIKK